MGALKDQITTEFRPWLPGAEADHAGHAVQVARRQPDAELLIELQRLNNNNISIISNSNSNNNTATATAQLHSLHTRA